MDTNKPSANRPTKLKSQEMQQRDHMWRDATGGQGDSPKCQKQSMDHIDRTDMWPCSQADNKSFSSHTTAISVSGAHI